MKNQYKFIYYHTKSIMEIYANLDDDQLSYTRKNNYLSIDDVHRIDGPAIITYFRKTNKKLSFFNSSFVERKYLELESNEDSLDEEICTEGYYLNGVCVGHDLKIYGAEQFQNYLLLL